MQALACVCVRLRVCWRLVAHVWVCLCSCASVCARGREFARVCVRPGNEGVYVRLHVVVCICLNLQVSVRARVVGMHACARPCMSERLIACARALFSRMCNNVRL